MKRKDIIETMKEYRMQTDFIERVSNRVPYINYATPDTNSKEYKKLVELKEILQLWLNEEID